MKASKKKPKISKSIFVNWVDEVKKGKSSLAQRIKKKLFGDSNGWLEQAPTVYELIGIQRTLAKLTLHSTVFFYTAIAFMAVCTMHLFWEELLFLI